MQYRTIGDGRVELTVSKLCLGTMYMGTRTDERTSFAILDRFLEAGGTFLDTANNYGVEQAVADPNHRCLVCTAARRAAGRDGPRPGRGDNGLPRPSGPGDRRAIALHRPAGHFHPLDTNGTDTRGKNMKRVLGRSGIEVSALGMGCWAIAGPWTLNGAEAGWGVTDDAESTRAIHAAIDLGVDFFDTAANYGAGHSERLLGAAVRDRRDRVVIATKVGHKVDEAARNVSIYGGEEPDSDVAAHLRADLERSLARLGTDYVDVYLLHVWGLSVERALEARDVFEDLVKEGKIRTYGWSTDRLDALEAFSTLPGCGVLEQELNVFTGSADILAFAERENLASIDRAPLGMGLLTGRITPETRFGERDIRRTVDWFPGFRDGRASREWLDDLAAIREILTAGGRTLAQGALAWLWGRSERTVPIPGFRTPAQVEENARAMEFGPLTSAQMREIDSILGR
jgi:aryl-alcohol dehydrogenase-like predicted oxidoreductase